MVNEKKSNIVFIGFMGTGKTTVGKIVAQRLNMNFIDLDKEIESKYDMSISNIFEKNGEKFFRELEKTTVRECSLLYNVVIATGGGVVLDRSNIDILRQNGLIICLKADMETIYRNVSQGSDRPLLGNENSIDRIMSIYKQRKGLYDSADYTIDISNKGIDNVVEEVIGYAKGYK